MIEQFIITAGDHITQPVGPFTSEQEAHLEYRRNQPKGLTYLAAPTIVRLLRPAHTHIRCHIRDCMGNNLSTFWTDNDQEVQLCGDHATVVLRAYSQS